MGSFSRLWLTDYLLMPYIRQGHSRTRRLEDVVEPEIRALAPVLAKQIFNDMQNARIRGDKVFLKKYHAERLSKQVRG